MLAQDFNQFDDVFVLNPKLYIGVGLVEFGLDLHSPMFSLRVMEPSQ
jgi:hypothetical protein